MTKDLTIKEQAGMAKKRQAAKSLVSTGAIPRTHSTAKNRGYKKSRFKFSDLSPELKSNFVQFEGGREGAVCGVAPSPDPAYWLVCYKDAGGRCNWVHVPKGDPVEAHG